MTVFGYAIPVRSSVPPSNIGSSNGFPGGLSVIRWAALGIGNPAQRTCMAIHPERPLVNRTCRITDTFSTPPIGSPHTAQIVNLLPPSKMARTPRGIEEDTIMLKLFPASEP